MPKNWARGLTKQTDSRVARAAEAHRGKKYQRRTAVTLCKFHRAGPVHVGPIEWTAPLAYAVGLMATDGCLIGSSKKLDFTSCDRDLVEIFLRCVGRPQGRIATYQGKRGPIYKATFGDLVLYGWMESIGLTPRKSLTLGSLSVPTTFIGPFVRGLLDGDGSVDCFVHSPIKRVDDTYRYQRLDVRFRSASRRHCKWLQELLREHRGLLGALLVEPKDPPRHDMHVLKYGKHASIALLMWLYEHSEGVRLERKFAIWNGFIQREKAGLVLYRRESTHRKALRAIAEAEADRRIEWEPE